MLDYGNAVMAGLPAYLFRRLQSVMNATARLIYGLRHSDHISDVLISLHWLRAQERVRFKMAVLMLASSEKTIWTKEATIKLLELVKRNYGAFTDRMTKNKSMWHEIAALLHDVSPGVTTSQCDQKWHNLKKAHKKYVDHQNKTGCGRMEKPNFFDDVDTIVSDSHSVRPTFTVDTAPATAPSETSLGHQPSNAGASLRTCSATMDSPE